MGGAAHAALPAGDDESSLSVEPASIWLADVFALHDAFCSVTAVPPGANADSAARASSNHADARPTRAPVLRL
jgi:hypothetical protein